VEFRRAAAQTGGQLVEADVIGRPRGFIAQAHVHTAQIERHEVIAGAVAIAVGARERTLGSGEQIEIPAGAAHTQRAAGTGEGRLRIQLRPALRTEAFLERLAALSRAGRFTRAGYPKPVAAAELIRDFGSEGHAAQPPVPIQRALSAAILRGAALLDGAAGEYVFVDEWDVDAPIEAVFAALADGRTYPTWWRPVYLDVAAKGPPAVGRVSHQHFKGRLPYHLRTRSTVTRLEAPHLVEGTVEGDLRGRGTWTLSPAPGGTHVRFDWRVHADRPLLRRLTPALRPVFRWNHAWAIARAIEGLEPYAGRNAAPARTAAPVSSG